MTAQKLQSHNPATGEIVWEGFETNTVELDLAIESAERALPKWRKLPIENRIAFLKKFAGKVSENRNELAKAISLETGKPLWESLQETDTMVAKVDNSIEAYSDRCATKVLPQSGFIAQTNYRPHGVLAVLGPFNLPSHLPHSHIVPALLAGNTIVYKPSEFTPGVGEFTTRLWQETGLPEGVLNLVQGGRNLGITLSSHPKLKGLFFTGSYGGGLALSKQFAPTPGKILALELGGNNPLVIWDCPDAAAAALLTVQSAFLTSGQRCVCARRLILQQGIEGDKILQAIMNLIPKLRIGPFTQIPEPFMGPLISVQAAQRLLQVQDELQKLGGKILMPMKSLDPKSASTASFVSDSFPPLTSAFLSPGLIDMTTVPQPPDEEYFGPLLQVIRVTDFDKAIEVANQTRFGLAAALIGGNRNQWEIFSDRIQAGIVNWNRQTTGASGKLPFGGIGDSGNHRPSAFAAADYCAYPMASLESEDASKTVAGALPKGIDP